MKQFIIFLLCIITSQITYADPAKSNQFLSIADIHFDPFASCHFSIRACKLLTQLRAADPDQWQKIFEQQSVPPQTFGKDSNYRLFKTMLSKLATFNQNDRPAFAIAIGDFLVHDFHRKYIVYSHDISSAGYQLFVKKTLAFVTYELHQALPNISIYPALGNNDSDSGDYRVIPQGTFLRETAKTWKNLILDPSERHAFRQSFPNAGYYSVIPQPFLRIIVLNSILFSTKAAHSTSMSIAADQELAWLLQELTAAKNNAQHVILVFHIPPGIDVYSFFKNPWGKPATFWQKKYADLFTAEVKPFAANIDAIFPAHIHRIIPQLMPIQKIGNIPVYFTPAISPVFGNSPGFRIFVYDASSFKPTRVIKISYPLNE
ncbi:MAG: hypothetical protein SFW66_02675 [Gammaproteobacteria bacterium]|nr:hypothetical protein [Gammaproteobacteria bacterium]